MDLKSRLAAIGKPVAPRSRIILILGPHRSGTSLVAKSMTCLGAALGERAEWYGPDNPSGFWEHQDVLAINEAILRELNRTWDDIAPLDSSLEVWLAMSPNAIALQRAAKELLRSELAAHSVFAIKEPRMCRLLPFWGSVFHAVNADVSVVHVARFPVDVAASLHRRNNMPMNVGLAVWAEHTRAARANVDRDWPSVTVLYDRMVADPFEQVYRVGAALGLKPDREEAEAFATAFVREDLRHEWNEADLPADIAVQWKVEHMDGMESA